MRERERVCEKKKACFMLTNAAELFQRGGGAAEQGGGAAAGGPPVRCQQDDCDPDSSRGSGLLGYATLCPYPPHQGKDPGARVTSHGILS